MSVRWCLPEAAGGSAAACAVCRVLTSGGEQARVCQKSGARLLVLFINDGGTGTRDGGLPLPARECRRPEVRRLCLFSVARPSSPISARLDDRRTRRTSRRSARSTPNAIPTSDRSPVRSGPQGLTGGQGLVLRFDGSHDSDNPQHLCGHHSPWLDGRNLASPTSILMVGPGSTKRENEHLTEAKPLS